MPKRRMKRHAVTQPQDPSYRLIPLTQGQNAIVNTSDYKWLNQWNWCAQWSPHTKSFYAVRRESGRIILMHRQILKCKRHEGDHRNHNSLDNRRLNLRKASRSQNGSNLRMRKDNTSGYRGVIWNKPLEKWVAQIKVGSRNIYLGLFLSAKEAARVRDQAAIKYQGSFASLNFTS
jgi:hypothetical protein